MAGKRHRTTRDAAFVEGRDAAARVWARRHELERLKQLDLQEYFAHRNAEADAELARLRAVEARVVADARVGELLRLRNEGWSLSAALVEVDRRFPASVASPSVDSAARPSNDNNGFGRTSGHHDN